jgi:spectrin alpha
VSDAAQEIIASGHPLSGDIQASLADLESQWAGLKAAAEERRARLAESASLAAFEKEAEDIDGWIKSKEPATDAPLGDDLASVRRALDAQEALDAEVAKFASTVSGLGKLKDKLSGDQPQSSDQLEKRYGKVLASWNHLLEAVRDRSEKLKELQAKLYGVEALLMEFAKLASAFNTWLEGAQEDLVDEVKSSSLDEIVTLRNAHLAFMDSLAGPAADIEKLKAVQGDIEAAGVQHNPYTPFSIDSLNSRWNSVLDLVDDRSDRLDKELARQEANEALRVEFAEKANAFAAWVSATRAIVTETGSSLAEQLALIRTKKGEIQNKRSDLQDIEDVSAKLEDALVLYNPHTEQTTTGISQEWQGLDQLAKRMEHNLEQQIAATQKSGVPEETLREYTEIFNHYDRDRNGSLDHVEFKSCLRALGYNLPVLAEGVTDAEYEAILAYVDPNRNGHVTRDDFIAFMISQSTEKAETADDLIEAFKTIAGEKSTVTEAELRSYLSKEQADYLLEKLKGFEAGAGQYDYEAWSRQNVPDSGAGAKRFNPASAAAAARN